MIEIASEDDSSFLDDVNEVLSDEELDAALRSSWNVKASAIRGAKTKKRLVKQREASTPKRLRLFTNDSDGDVHDIHLNLQPTCDYVKQINANLLKLQKHQQQIKVTLDRQEKFLNTLCNNQKKLAKSLAKHKVKREYFLHFKYCYYLDSDYSRGRHE